MLVFIVNPGRRHAPLSVRETLAGRGHRPRAGRERTRRRLSDRRRYYRHLVHRSSSRNRTARRLRRAVQALDDRGAVHPSRSVVCRGQGEDGGAVPGRERLAGAGFRTYHRHRRRLAQALRRGAVLRRFFTLGGIFARFAKPALSDYVQPRAKGSAFTDFYLRFFAHHLRAIAKPSELYEDTTVTRLPWRGQIQRVCLVVYRRAPMGNSRRVQTPEPALSTL